MQLLSVRRYRPPPPTQNMPFSLLTRLFAPWASQPAAFSSYLLVYTHFTSPLILLCFFLGLLTTHGIVTTPKDVVTRASSQATGPGGKPLPQKASPSAKSKARREKEDLDVSPARKLLFIWLAVGVILSFVGNAVVVIIQAVLYRKDHWWCGKSVAVLHHRTENPR